MPKYLALYGTVTLLVFFGSGVSFAQSSGSDIYKSKCQMCHAADGSGNTPAGKSMGAQSFKRPEAIKMSDAELTAIVKDGKGKMPKYAGKLTDAQITEVVAYIRTLQK